MEAHLLPITSNSTEKLGRYDNLISGQVELLDGLAGDDLADTVRVDIRGVKEVDAGIVGSLDEGERLFLCLMTRLVPGAKRLGKAVTYLR